MKILLYGDLHMRLYNIYYTCKTVLSDIENLHIVETPTEAKRLVSWESYKQALFALSSFDFIKEDVKATYNVLNPIELEQTQPVIGKNTHIELIKKNEILLSKIKAVIDCYSAP